MQLFSKDSDGEPLEAVKDIQVSNNQFVFFPVSIDSYHQVVLPFLVYILCNANDFKVAEVTHKNECRMSINGWFHTSKPPIYDNPVSKPPDRGLYSSQRILPQPIDIDLETWISSFYLDQDTMKKIQKHVEDDSEISLRNFFNKEPLHEVLEALNYDGT